MSFSPKGKKPVGNPLVVVRTLRRARRPPDVAAEAAANCRLLTTFFAALAPRHPSDDYVLVNALPERARQGWAFFVTAT
jgi:hypothetical protein